jgi:hypothetical protein
MKRIHSALASTDEPRVLGWDLTRRTERPLVLRVNMYKILAATAALSLTFGCAFAQTTRTNPSSSSTTSTIPSSSSTSPNSPCASTNPTSPCYAAKSPRNPCYDAAAPGKPCSTTITPSSQVSPTPSPSAAATPQADVRAFTEDQAKAQIEAKGYSIVSRLRKDAEGIWRGKAAKDGLQVDVTLDAKGKVTAN